MRFIELDALPSWLSTHFVHLRVDFFLFDDLVLCFIEFYGKAKFMKQKNFPIFYWLSEMIRRYRFNFGEGVKNLLVVEI